jgi:hypothetical protein
MQIVTKVRRTRFGWVEKVSRGYEHEVVANPRFMDGESIASVRMIGPMRTSSRD